MLNTSIRKLTLATLTVVAGLATTGAAKADHIQTFGAQTQYQDAFPDQYDLCLTVDTSYHLVSDICSTQSNQQLIFSGAHITYTARRLLSPYRWITTTYYATNHGSYVSMDASLGEGASQDWYLEGSALQNGAGGCLDVHSGDVASGAPMDVVACNGTQAQWFWAPSAESFQLYNYGSNACLTESSGALGVSSCLNGTNPTQQWVFTTDQQIQNVASGHCVLENGGELVPSTCDATLWTSGQEWSANTQEYGFLQSAASGACITDVGGSARTTVCSDPEAANTAQFWVER